MQQEYGDVGRIAPVIGFELIKHGMMTMKQESNGIQE